MVKSGPRGLAIGWTQKQVDAEKAKIKKELDRAASSPGAPSRLESALTRLTALAEDDTPRGRLRRYIFAMSALVQHERGGGLSSREIDELVTLAYAILQAQGVRPRASRLASLFGDIHLIRSQIFRKQGEPWRAAWEQQVALQLAGEFPSGGLGFQLLAAGNRALRLGHARLALSQFAEGLEGGLPEAAESRCQLARLHAAWLAGDAQTLATAVAAGAALPLADDVKAEFAWNLLARGAAATGELAPLLSATRRGGTHAEATYVVEACYWGLAVESRSFVERLPRLGSMRRNKTLKPQRLGLWYEAGVVLQDCYDHDVPLTFRLRALSEVIERRQELLTVDKELLLLAAATRWLARSKAASLALLVLSEYRALSQRLSDGAAADALGVLKDLEVRSWTGIYFSSHQSLTD